MRIHASLSALSLRRCENNSIQRIDTIAQRSANVLLVKLSGNRLHILFHNDSDWLEEDS